MTYKPRYIYAAGKSTDRKIVCAGFNFGGYCGLELNGAGFIYHANDSTVALCAQHHLEQSKYYSMRNRIEPELEQLREWVRGHTALGMGFQVVRYIDLILNLNPNKAEELVRIIGESFAATDPGERDERSLSALVDLTNQKILTGE